MKKTLIVTAIALLSAAGMTMNATAQETTPPPAAPMVGGHGHHHHHHGSGMMADLNLTDAQKTQVNDIMTQHRDETHAKIRALLTPEQQKNFDAMPAQQPQHRGGPMGVMESLNLTDAQKAQVADVMKQERTDAQAKIRAILTPEQQKTFDARIQKQAAKAAKRQQP
ncbi:MAG: Spy/CpxP family protein refolding chaperone [Betaproteobacteria bacterium]|nr:Spy/CpxP family protein refolding chaperone [Betaproteobacteria bacterium]